MRYGGTSMQIRLRGDGNDDCMIGTPNFGFEWQRLYRYDAPLGERPLAIGAILESFPFVRARSLDRARALRS